MTRDRYYAHVHPEPAGGADGPIVTRRPICDCEGRLKAHDIVVDPTGPAPEATDSGAWALHIVANVLGVDTLAAPGELLFVRATEPVLARHHYLALPPERTVLVVDDVCRKTGLCARASEHGYAVAADQHGGADPGEDAGAVQFVRAGVRGADERTLSRATEGAHARLQQFIALEVDDNPTLDLARRCGCDLVQGKTLLATVAGQPRDIRGIAAVHLRLLSHLSAPELDRPAVADTIALDVALTHGLLRRVNSAAYGVRQKVSSIPQALALLGDGHIRAWAGLAALAGLKGEQPTELVLMSLIRARLCSTLASAWGRQAIGHWAYLVGLLSSLDIILSLPMSRVVEQLPLNADIAAVLLGDRVSDVGRLLDLAIACERGAWATLQERRCGLGLSQSAVTTKYYEALAWARNLSRSL